MMCCWGGSGMKACFVKMDRGDRPRYVWLNDRDGIWEFCEGK